MNHTGGTSLSSRVFDVFRVEGRWSWPILLTFLIIQLIVLYNALAHDGRFGYDGPGHMAYVRTLAEGRLPTPQDSHEFFSPPLPYVPAAIAWRLLDASSNDTRAILALKVGQLVQFLGSILACWSVLAIAKLVRPDGFMRLASLVALGIVPTHYRTFAMVRGEPLMVALLLLGTYFVLRCYAIDRPTYRKAILAGLLLGGAVLCRQWAFFALPALGLVGLWRLIVDADRRRATLLTGLALLASAALVGGWYYAHLHREYGSIRAFNRPPEEEEAEVKAQTPPDQLLRAMVKAPVRDAFNHHPFWLFYADMWGDYWNYFATYARDHRGRLVKAVLIERTVESGRSKGTNARTMPAYLGRVCAVSIVPTLALLGGLVYGLWQIRRWPRSVEASQRIVLPLVSLGVIFTLAGYCWFVATYPNVRLDTVKASYPLQIYPLIALTTAAMWCVLRDRWPRVAVTLGVLLLAVFAHNAGTLFTRYSLF